MARSKGGYNDANYSSLGKGAHCPPFSPLAVRTDQRIMAIRSELKAWLWKNSGMGEEVYAFLAEHASTLEEACVRFEGTAPEHRLEYTILHESFRNQFESRLLEFLVPHGVDMTQVPELLSGIGIGEDDDFLIDLLLRVVEYEHWLSAILSLHREVQGTKERLLGEDKLAGQGKADTVEDSFA
mmetsp:Transcript_65908/g.141039  ORF Transcript_65908/g.141039 Transcript_65908/m.141039 type:complete len:183 (+) Transcript_65908:92-640(+)